MTAISIATVLLLWPVAVALIALVFIGLTIGFCFCVCEGVHFVASLIWSVIA